MPAPLDSTEAGRIATLEAEIQALRVENAAFAKEVETHTTAAANKLRKMMESLMMKKFGLLAELETRYEEVFEELDKVMDTVYEFSEGAETAGKTKGA